MVATISVKRIPGASSSGESTRTMHNPLLSVAIPTRNRIALLRRAIQSVLQQSFQDYEILVIDNASADETRTVRDEFASDRLLYHRNDQDIGIIGNWNRAID